MKEKLTLPGFDPIIQRGRVHRANARDHVICIGGN
jgi:hypothetical protein